MAAMLLNVSLVALGGALGSSLRYLMGLALTRTFAISYPVGILPLNVIGSFLMGVFVVYAHHKGYALANLFVMTGRNARVEGYDSLIAHGYPTVSVPDSERGNFTLAHAIMRQESQFDPQAVSHAGARGLMQLMPGTAREVSGKLGLAYRQSSLNSDTDYNIRLGSSYIDQMLRYFGGNYVLAIAAYNAGPGNVNKWLRANGDPRQGVDVITWIENIPIYETKNYVQRVLENLVMYDTLYPAESRRSGGDLIHTYLGQ